jgi:hypothetical protein
MTLVEQFRPRSEARAFARRDPLPLPPGNSFTRSITAQVLAQIHRRSPADEARDMWPNDRMVMEWLTRATSVPALTTTTGWAAELIRQMVSDAAKAMGPASAGAQLLEEGLLLSFNGVGNISVPGFTAAAGNASFVAEGNPIPVRALTAAAATLVPYKIAQIAALSREQLESSNAEQFITDALVRSAGLALDAVLFGNAAAIAGQQPAGLRNGISALTASTNPDLNEAFVEDVTALFGAISTVAGSGPYVLITSGGRAALAGTSRRIGESDNVLVLGASAVGNDIIAVAPVGLVAAIDPEPELETSNAGTLVMDTAPGAAGTMGPERSLYQTDSIAIKMRWAVSWALRSSAAVAWLTPTWK